VSGPGRATETLRSARAHPGSRPGDVDRPAEASPAHLSDRGYSTFEGRELGCDGGAAEALRRDRTELAVAAYFQWRPDATDFLSLLKPAQGATPETTRGFVDLLPVRWDCAS
jgi:hypothetical protein